MKDDFVLKFIFHLSYFIFATKVTPPKLCGDCGTQMDVNPGLFALPGLDPITNPDGTQGLNFNFSRGLPVTVYVCPSCGRFKFMSAILLNNIEGQQRETPARADKFE
jgi:hypothetical protein